MNQLDEKTSLPLKIVVPVCTTIVAAAFWIGIEVHSIRVLMQSAWTVHDMERWGSEAQMLNPGTKFPDAYNIVQRRKAADLTN